MMVGFLNRFADLVFFLISLRTISIEGYDLAEVNNQLGFLLGLLEGSVVVVGKCDYNDYYAVILEEDAFINFQTIEKGSDTDNSSTINFTLHNPYEKTITLEKFSISYDDDPDYEEGGFVLPSSTPISIHSGKSYSFDITFDSTEQYTGPRKATFTLKFDDDDIEDFTLIFTGNISDN